jgi:transcriptional regulator GlxA family with amidase domain
MRCSSSPDWRWPRAGWREQDFAPGYWAYTFGVATLGQGLMLMARTWPERVLEAVAGDGVRRHAAAGAVRGGRFAAPAGASGSYFPAAPTPVAAAPAADRGGSVVKTRGAGPVPRRAVAGRLRADGRFRRSEHLRRSPDQGYRLVTVGTAPYPIRASNGQQLGADHQLDDAGADFADFADFDIGAGGGRPRTGRCEADNPAAVRVAAQDAAQTVPRYGSICTGAFLLGRAGLLDGKQATTHWSDATRLAAQFPLAQVEHDRIHVRDGALVTSAGVTAGIDLALALVAEDHGPAVALAVAKRLLVLAQRQGGQSQFSPYLSEAVAPDALASVIQRYVMDHLAESLSVEHLADVAGMSARNFARQFVKEMAVTPAEFVQRARIDAARNLLEGGELALKTIAYRCGFGSAARMRLVFSQRFGVTPNQYRDSFRRVD